MALGKRERHQPGHAGNINVQRVNAHVRLPVVPGKPGRQGFKGQGFSGPAEVGKLLRRQENQWMYAVVGSRPITLQGLVGVCWRDEAVGQQPRQQRFEIKRAIGRTRGLHKYSLYCTGTDRSLSGQVRQSLAAP